MHWLTDAAKKAGLNGAGTLLIPLGSTPVDAWEITARTLGVSGDAIIRRLRADPRTAALPIIVLTGSSETSRESELIELGADDYIRKPIEPALLVARVRAALRRAAA
jgi:putative two-component system response regulator